MRLDIFLPLRVTGRIISITSETAPLIVLFLGVTGYTIGPVVALIVRTRVGVLVGVIPMAGAVDVV